MTWSESHGIAIVGLGAVTSIGRCALASAAAVRAGITGFAKHAYMVDVVGLPMQVAPMAWLDEACDVAERIGHALISSLHEALAPLLPLQPQPLVTLLVNLPSARPGLPADLDKRIDKMLRSEFGKRFGGISYAALGHAGGLLALQSAQRRLAAEPLCLCVVAGADSYLEPDVLEWLEQTGQLHGAGERNNAWGFVPGEGAGALLLGAPELVRRLGLARRGTIGGVGVGRESELIGTGTVCLGLGLTVAVRAALAGLPAEVRLTDVYCDMNGEPYRADEFAFLVTRTRERFVSASDFVAPADCWGDMGAASAPLLIMLACIAAEKGYAKGDSTLVWASSVGGERGAALIETMVPTA